MTGNWILLLADRWLGIICILQEAIPDSPLEGRLQFLPIISRNYRSVPFFTVPPVFNPTSSTKKSSYTQNIGPLGNFIPPTSTIAISSQTNKSKFYSKLCDIRKLIELKNYVPSIVKSPPSKYEGLRLCTAEELSKIYKLHMPAILDLLNESFPEYATMEEQYKWPLFQSFMAFMWRLDNGWRTLKTGVEPDKFGIM